ncbi:prevent-host-death family protein [Arthrobacter pigmenti]|uniref:Antitoxin n=1 Tax=Arthrobacter pigmenti TaxID=271432 RepID=A0A846RKE7_9MICC|nr:type II toxin-antitoxin system prevent-host-death family antitoxin [Arthrobacter pigmenti]NJC21132.1 prevent-host-death family protein [Arthrobacter pigmenti]
MTRVGMRELRNHLSDHVMAASAGTPVTITDHGRAVARIVPIAESSLLEELLAAQLATAPVRRARTVPDPTPTQGTVSDLVADQRR